MDIVIPAPGNITELPSALLTRAEERALAEAIEVGVLARAALAGEVSWPQGALRAELLALAEEGARARAALVEANMGLVWSVVLPLTDRTGLDFAELFQEGVVGLLESIERFDPRRGKFATCALPRIRMRSWDAAVTGMGSLGLPPRRARQWRRIHAIAGDLLGVLARMPSVDEVAQASGESARVVASLLSFQPPVVVDVSDEGQTAASVVGSGWGARRPGGPTGMLAELLADLSPGDRAIIAQLYGLDGPAHTHQEVARRCGRSVTTVRRREREALAQLRSLIMEEAA